MKRFLLFFLVSCLCMACSDRQESIEVVTPNAVQRNWADAEVGVLIHFDMPVYKSDYQWRKFGTHPDASVFNPTELNTDQWLETASKLGAKYAVLVAKHCSGFSLWPTEAHEYSIKNSPWKEGKGDIVKDFIASCKKYNIKPGIYASTTANGYLHVVNPGRVVEGSPVTQREYNKIVTQQLTELWSNYGELFEIWFDGGVLSKKEGGADVLSLVQQLQPQAVAFQGPYGHPNLVRWVGNEKGTAPDPCWATADSTTREDGLTVIDGLNGNPNAPYWCPGESDFTLRWNNSFQGGWFWREGEDDKIFSVDELMKKYETSVGRNTNMLLGLVVNDKGLIPDADVRRVEEFGKAIKDLYGTPVAETSGTGKSIVLKLKEPTSVDRAIIQEDIALGERVLSYKLQAKIKGEWREIYKSESIGHKRIAKFKSCITDELKLTILKSKAQPHIQSFRVFQTI